ncbi:hypothetical protein M514_20448 [Trichuris suis]|uniref:Uncharacterized protein n=1 Tax=Trichuris suis TaxID=68888 RepID=A0A085LVP4_9BILA|nr:hypothetical protein M513_10088 [Trichuris suis]KFD60733.1 hypothetical protein M514_10088 [Trichuris suis]KFD67412.1 hypothetical protein M514_20448 [Trichuris suis]
MDAVRIVADPRDIPSHVLQHDGPRGACARLTTKVPPSAPLVICDPLISKTPTEDPNPPSAAHRPPEPSVAPLASVTSQKTEIAPLGYTGVDEGGIRQRSEKERDTTCAYNTTPAAICVSRAYLGASNVRYALYAAELFGVPFAPPGGR